MPSSWRTRKRRDKFSPVIPMGVPNVNAHAPGRPAAGEIDATGVATPPTSTSTAPEYAASQRIPVAKIETASPSTAGMLSRLGAARAAISEEPACSANASPETSSVVTIVGEDACIFVRKTLDVPDTVRTASSMADSGACCGQIKSMRLAEACIACAGVPLMRSWPGSPAALRKCPCRAAAEPGVQAPASEISSGAPVPAWRAVDTLDAIPKVSSA